LKAIYKGPSQIYNVGGKTFERNGKADEISQPQLKQAKDNGHRFEVMQVEKEKEVNK